MGVLTFGYGSIRVSEFPPRQMQVHRYSYELANGPIPDGLLVCHACDVNYPPGDITYRSCVRPDHLFLGTNQDNMDDMAQKGRRATGDRSGSRRHPERLPNGERQHSAKLTDADVVDIRDLHKRGEPATKIALAYGLSNVAVLNLLHAKTWTYVPVDGGPIDPPEIRKGSKHGMAKLNEQQVIEMRALYAAGPMTYRAIGERYDISPSMVGLIVQRKNWTHV